MYLTSSIADQDGYGKFWLVCSMEYNKFSYRYVKERNFKHFNEREFNETIDSIDVYNLLQLNINDPNFSMENIHNHVNFILDEFAPFRKLNKCEIKLKSKPWISKDILFLMWERDKMFSKYIP